MAFIARPNDPNAIRAALCGRYPKLELTPPQRRLKTMEALTAQVEALSRSNPVLMIFEDVHWIDPTSLKALGRVVDKISTVRVLLIVTHRPEFQPPWTGKPNVTPFTVNRLGQREIASLIEHVTGNKALPEKLKQDIIDRTDGVPLFVEEMTKAVLEAESEERSERVVATIPSPSVAVPASLHASLMARLDRLGPAKEVAQIGAAPSQIALWVLQRIEVHLIHFSRGDSGKFLLPNFRTRSTRGGLPTLSSPRS